ncbi:MAG: hypothetical protein LC749_00075 [Actinobacteria bacterium]|nr:hypothetical protein [Actinomycetota bacterium]
MQQFLPQAQAFVESHRHLRFSRPVQVTALADDAFQKRLAALPGDSAADLEKATKELHALGLIEAHIDLGKLQQELLGQAVAGFYDPPTRALVVRGGRLTPHVRDVIVHELTHAVQDQNFNINRPEVEKAPDEQSIGLHTLLEGDALRIEAAYHQTLTEAERSSADEESAAGSPSEDTPRVLLQQLEFPYDVGPPFVDAVLAKRGEADLDAAFIAPPTTSSQVMHPERYLAGRGAIHVDPPAADGPVFDQSALGEENLLILLEEAVHRGKLQEAEAQAAAATWAGDWSSAWDAGSRSCIRVTIVTEGSPDTLRRALRAYASGPGATVTSRGPLTLTSCA